ncbi:MAG: heavy-metal-associated domain-containing protein, partial [Haloferacaceae archaeon]|nr:heavy-metal-associated domain-containing protein [Haloferacaceae archaeon]
MSDDSVRLDIAGMTCANCAATVEEAIAGVAAVDAVTVNSATDTASVTVAPDADALAAVPAGSIAAMWPSAMPMSTRR